MSKPRGFFGKALGLIDRISPPTVVHAATITEELTLPDKLETAEAMLSDPREVNKWLQAGRFVDLQKRYNKLSEPDLPTQIANILDAREAANGTTNKATKQAMDEWMLEHGMVGSKINRPNLDSGKIVPVRNAVAKQIEELGFANLGDFAKETWHRNPKKDKRDQIQQIMDAAFSGTEAPGGGYLIPETLDNEIRSLILPETVVRSNGATVIDMTSPKMLFPFLDSNTNTATSFGGWTVTRVEEGGTITPSRPNFGRVKLDVTKQVAGAEVPNEMFADVSSLDGYIRQTLPVAMGLAEDYDFLNGSGAGAPLGILNAANTALVTVAAETNQPASTINIDNVLNMYSRMLSRSKARAVWLINPTVMKKLWQLSIAVGTGGAPVMLMNASNGGPTTLLGRPVIETELVPALGSAGQMLFVDLSYYLIGQRPGTMLESSPHAQFMNDLTEMKATSRNDGRPWLQGVYTPVNGDTMSAFVQLGAVA